MTTYYKKYRKEHTKYRNKMRKNNYDKTRPEKRTNKKWTNIELFLIKCPVLDRILAKCLKRSVHAIQQKRYRLNKEKTKCQAI